jgi:glycosyltransferase involved in cell wall biosynthesis
VLLALGRLHTNKGFDVLLRALAELPDNVLWLAGDGPEEAALRELATALNVTDRVRFLGWREDGPALLAASDVLVSSSRHEPLGNVVLEGWVRGVPVVACASDGPAHLITHGESGLLCPIEDPSALAAEIRLVLEDDALYRRLSAGGRATHEADYSEAAVVGRYVNFFKEITASS